MAQTSYSQGHSVTDRLTDYVFLVLGRFTLNDSDLLPADRAILNYVLETQDISPFVAEAFLLMGNDLFVLADERPSFGDGRTRALDHEDAIALVRTHGSLRLAAEATGISKSALQRAASQNYDRKAAA